MNSDILLSIDVPKDSYYANMYDIEDLTHLSKKDRDGVSQNIKTIENKIINNDCPGAYALIEKLI